MEFDLFLSILSLIFEDFLEFPTVFFSFLRVFEDFLRTGRFSFRWQWIFLHIRPSLDTHLNKPKQISRKHHLHCRKIQNLCKWRHHHTTFWKVPAYSQYNTQQLSRRYQSYMLFTKFNVENVLHTCAVLTILVERIRKEMLNKVREYENIRRLFCSQTCKHFKINSVVSFA